MKEQDNILAAGGSCFPAGTQINTPNGYVNIEDINVGDQVYAYDISSIEPGEFNLPGRIVVSTVTETHIHEFGESDYESPLLVIKHSKGELKVTGNHYILTPKRKSKDPEADPKFVRADELQVGDVLFTEFGEESIIEAIEAGDEYDFVYNFEVEGVHTYVANGIRVHNGGGGKKGGSSRPPRQAPNTIRTNQVVNVLLLNSEGEVGGLADAANPAKSVFFDGTPVQNPDGTFNFENVIIDQRYGLPDQDYIEGFAAVESELTLGQIVYAETPVTRTTTSNNVDAIRVTIEFPNGLMTTDRSTGDTNGTTVSLRLGNRSGTDPWNTVRVDSVSEMSSSAFQVSYMIRRPLGSTGPWDFRVERVTADSTDTFVVNTFMVKSYTEIQDVKIAYDNRAVVGIQVGANSTNNKIPTIAMDVVGVKIKVPNNYDPVTRTYSGPWSGLFADELQVCDNPAWILYDILTNERYGLGSKVDEDIIDRYSFYSAAQYNDELVNDGKGTGTFEPRFTFNTQFMVREDAWKSCQAVAATFNSKMYMHNGVIKVAQDRPAAVTRIITNSNVANGIFNYSSSAASERTTQCNVTYNDPADGFLPNVVTEQDDAGIIRYGLQSKDIIAYGATTEGQARRAAKWEVYTAMNSTQMVEFTVSAMHADIEPHELFYVMDNDYADATLSGRVVATTGTTLELDVPVDVSSGTWTIEAVSADGTTIVNAGVLSGTGNIIHLATALDLLPGAAFVLVGAISPRQFRSISLTEKAPGEYSITALQHNPEKYVAIESGIVIPPPVYTKYPDFLRIDVPTNLTISSSSTVTPDGFVYRRLFVSWTPPADGSASYYELAYRKNGSTVGVLTSEIPSAQIMVDTSGRYEVFLNAVNANQVQSPTVSAVFDLDLEEGSGSSLSSPSNLRLDTGTTFFNTTAMNMLWDAPVINNPDIMLRDYQITFRETVGGAVFRTEYTTSTEYSYTYAQNMSDLGKLKDTIYVEVRARDTNNKLSLPVVNTFYANSVSSITDLYTREGGLSFSTLDLQFNWVYQGPSGASANNDPTFSYFRVQVLNSNGDILRSDNIRTNNYTYTFQNNLQDNGGVATTSIIVNVVPVNIYGAFGTGATATFSPVVPSTVTGLQVFNGGLSFNTVDLNVVWTCMYNNSTYENDPVFSHYLVESVDNFGNVLRSLGVQNRAFTYLLAMNRDDHLGVASRAPTLRVSAVSKYGIKGVALAATFENPAPSVPSNILAVGTLGGLKVTFDYPIEADYEGAFIWVDTVPGFTPDNTNLVATITGSYASITDLVANTDYYVRVAAFDSFDKNTYNLSAQVSTTTAPAPGIPSFPSDPSGAVEGDFYFNTTDGKLYRFYNGVWTAAVDTSDLEGYIGAHLIAANTITGDMLVANTITAGKIAASTITSNEIAANTISAGNIATNAITADKINAGAITTDKLAADSVTANKIVSGSITGDKIQAGSITANEMATGTITASSGVIANAAISSAMISDWLVSDAVDSNGDPLFEVNLRTGELNLRSNGTGGRMLINPEYIRMWDANNILRVELGKLI